MSEEEGFFFLFRSLLEGWRAALPYREVQTAVERARGMPGCVSYFGGENSMPSPARSDENYSPGE